MATNSSPLPRNTVDRNRSSLCPDAVPDHGQEPQEGDARERRHVQRADRDGPLGGRLEPVHEPGFGQADRWPRADQHGVREEQQRERDARQPPTRTVR